MTEPRESLSSVLLYKRGWRFERPLQVSSLRAAWAINSPGRLSCLLPVRDQVLTGVDWLGRWVVWEHPTMGIFGGFVEDAPIDTGAGTLELVTPGFIQILAKRRTRRRYKPVMGPPGAILAHGLSGVVLGPGMPFELSVSERGPFLSYEFRAENAMSMIQELAGSSAQEWDAGLLSDRTLKLTWREKIGRNETARVVFTEGVNIIDARIEQTTVNTVNDLLGIADDDQYRRAQGARIIAAGSRGRFGVMQDTQQYKGVVTKSTLLPRVQKDLKTLALPTTSIALRVWHMEPRLQYVRNGTEFRFVSASGNAVYRARVLAREVDMDSGIVTLTCDAVSDVTRATQLDSWAYGGIDLAAGL